MYFSKRLSSPRFDSCDCSALVMVCHFGLAVPRSRNCIFSKCLYGSKLMSDSTSTHHDGSKSQRVDIHYKFIGYVEMKEMFGLPMVMAMAKDVEIDDVLIAGARGLAKEIAG